MEDISSAECLAQIGHSSSHELLESRPEGEMGLSLCAEPGLCFAQRLLDQEAGMSQVSWFNLGLAQAGKFGLSEPQFPELCGPSE